VEILEQVQVQSWSGPFPDDVTGRAISALEEGKILFGPGLSFQLSAAEQKFLSTAYLSAKAKNISYNTETEALGGTDCQGVEREELAGMMRRFAGLAIGLLRALCPAYAAQCKPGLTSFRPAEISGRATSWRKDDTRLHVDAFPSRPSYGKRILRLFANVNPSTARVWRAGEPFQDAARKLLPRVSPPLPGALAAMALLKITKERRSLYDHYMLGLHDAMKADPEYQAGAPQTRLEFAPGAVWACYTDLVPHAAMSGQHAFEQTFYLPVNAMASPALSPLRTLERILERPLV
jgi:3-deoxy-D-manno-oct-2-ulosonic acid (Kdo) hydroxylase